MLQANEPWECRENGGSTAGAKAEHICANACLPQWQPGTSVSCTRSPAERWGNLEGRAEKKTPSLTEMCFFNATKVVGVGVKVGGGVQESWCVVTYAKLPPGLAC